MKKIGIVVNLRKQEALNTALELIKLIEEQRADSMLCREAAVLLGISEEGYSLQQMGERADLLLILGGDGTLLNIAKSACFYNLPILGINLGRLGFLTEVEVGSIRTAIKQLIDGDYIIEERTMLEASSSHNKSMQYLSLNDIVISRGSLSRIISYNISINNIYLDSYMADGVIIATPTGSTAYSLSAGGPIVCPSIPGIVLTPVCPHTLYSRSLVINNSDKIDITLTEIRGEAYMTVDGQKGIPLVIDETITICKSSMTTKLIKLKEQSFYRNLRTRLIEPVTKGK